MTYKSIILLLGLILIIFRKQIGESNKNRLIQSTLPQSIIRLEINLMSARACLVYGILYSTWGLFIAFLMHDLNNNNNRPNCYRIQKGSKNELF